MSSLRRFQSDPRTLLNTALNMYRSKRIKTAVVEGVCDKRFLNQWIVPGTHIRFDGFNGKKLVESSFLGSRSKPYSEADFMYFFADVDFDGISGVKIHDHPSFIYNAFCFDTGRTLFNDLECYLLNTTALEKILANLDIETGSAKDLRQRLEQASRDIGAFRAADILVRRANNLSSSVLNGLEVRAFFNEKEITVDLHALKKALPNWSNYKEYTNELIETAERLHRESPTPWSLSRGHDVTEMLALHLESRGSFALSKDKVELMLRLACEFSEFEKSPMAKKLSVDPHTWLARLAGD